MTTAQPVQKPRLTADLISTMIWTVLAALVSIAVGLLFWKLGADFTILALKWFARGLGISQDGWGWYIVPLLFSAIELAAWKKRKELTQRVLILARSMTALDMGSTAFGVFLAIVTNYLVMLGVVNPSQAVYGVALVVAGAAGWAVTLYPERLVLDGVIQIYLIGKSVYLIWKGGK